MAPAVVCTSIFSLSSHCTYMLPTGIYSLVGFYTDLHKGIISCVSWEEIRRSVCACCMSLTV